MERVTTTGLVRRPVAVARGVYRLFSLGCWVYALVDDGEITLIDVGIQGSLRVLARQLGRLGLDPSRIRRVILSHCHYDHSAGVYQVWRATGCEVLAHAAEVPYLSGAVAHPSPFQLVGLRQLAAPFYRRLVAAGVPVTPLADDDELNILGGLRVVHSPGHTPGSISLQLVEAGLLFTGDALQYRFARLMGPSRMFTEDMPEARRSIARLSTLDVETLCFAHFPPLEGASRRLRALVRDWGIAAIAAGRIRA